MFKKIIWVGCFCLFMLMTIQAQTASKIVMLENIGIPQDFNYTTTWSDSLLHFYRLDVGSASYTLQHWTCNPSGEWTEPLAIFTFNNGQAWTTEPSYKYYFRNYGTLYLNFRLENNLHFLGIAEDHSVQLNIIPLIYDCTLFTPNYLFYNYRADILSPSVVYKYDLNTGSTDSLFSWNRTYPVAMTNIDNKYLLLFETFDPNQINSVMIDTLLAVHQCNLNISIPYLNSITISAPEILPNMYFGNADDGLLRNSLYGYCIINDYNIDFFPLSYFDNMNPYPMAYWYACIIPYGNGRFSCLQSFVDESFNSFRNYQFTGSEFTEDFAFPDLHSYVNPFALYRLDAQYGLAVCGTDNNPRKFILIDYEHQAITDTTFSMSLAPDISACSVQYSQNYLYYVYKTYQSRRLYIMKAVEFTGNNDPVQPAQIISASAYPNPFSNFTTIKIDLKQPAVPKVTIYNLKGQLVKTLLPHSDKSKNFNLEWDGTTQSGAKVAPGIYFYQVADAENHKINGKIILLP
ncbi:MAG TPA: T9SS type A sorting domain-containing protein [Candidatus Cloacimonadota bacterium]|nr:T9SS type A sorting domain-containing protein [Candidatus Cloacimonadota bacterium]HQL14814.1 T9SS type A sorting domain-containing protein [Candidatus Cloacimonadota bacterium]